MKVAIITFPGSNCDQDCHRSVELAGGSPRYVWHRETSLGGVDAVIVPGGFAHGDYLRPGAIARFSPIMEAVTGFGSDGGLIVGICTASRSSARPGCSPCAAPQRVAALPVPPLQDAGGAHRHGVHRKVRRRAGAGDAAVTRGRELLRATRHPGHPGSGGAGPVSAIATPAASNPEGNPNGSLTNIAGIMSERGNVLGMMPHPDRAVEAVLGSLDGLPLFESLIGALARAEVA